MSGAPLSPELIAFFITAAAAIVSALFVVAHRNPVVNAAALIANLACVAVFFLLLHAPFLAAVQVIVYAGAIMVLFLFVIMLLDLRAELQQRRGGMFQRWMTLLGAAALLALLATALRQSRQTFTLATTPGAEFGTTEQVARRMFTEHWIPVELASVLLLVAMVGALLLTRAFRERPSAGDAGGAR